MKYIKLFETVAAYNAAILDLPNVSLIEENMSVYYNPYMPETKLVVYYDIQDISSPTTVCTNYDGSFKLMEIDGVDNVDITAQNNITYQFDSVGEHVIKYELNGLGVGTNAPLFYNVSTVKRVIIPNTFTSIGQYAFQKCSSLTSVTIGSGVTTISKSAFDSCTGLTSIVIPNSVTTIDSYAFQKCSGLTSCSIGSDVTSIGEKAFSDCTNLISVTIPDSVTTIGNFAFNNCSGMTSCTIGDGVTSIGQYAFQKCSSLTSCTIGSSVTSIGDWAFNSCSGLTSIDIPDSVTSISDNAFYGCSSLTSIVSNAMTAPTIINTTFKDIKTNGTLTVPVGSTGYDIWLGTENYYLGLYNWTKVEQ